MTQRTAKRFLREGQLDTEQYSPDAKIRRLWGTPLSGINPMSRRSNQNQKANRV